MAAQYNTDYSVELCCSAQFFHEPSDLWESYGILPTRFHRKFDIPIQMCQFQQYKIFSVLHPKERKMLRIPF
jgi:hypothetical protein